MVSMQTALMLMSAVLIALLVFRKLDGKKGTWDSKDSIEEHAVLLLSTDDGETPKRRRRRPEPPPQDPQKRPTAPESAGEKEARLHLEKRFSGETFEKARPDFLKNPITNANLELDCYCPRLNLALEYNGRQHYEWVPKFQKTRADFYNQQYRDRMKRQLCKENGVDLIEVPYYAESIPLYIDTELEKLGRIRLL